MRTMNQAQALDDLNKIYQYIQPDRIKRVVYETSRQLRNGKQKCTS